MDGPAGRLHRVKLLVFFFKEMYLRFPGPLLPPGLSLSFSSFGRVTKSRIFSLERIVECSSLDHVRLRVHTCTYARRVMTLLFCCCCAVAVRRRQAA